MCCRTGEFCQEQLQDPCLFNPCKNGARCEAIQELDGTSYKYEVSFTKSILPKYVGTRVEANEQEAHDK